MKSNYTRIVVVLDRSGSMATCRESTVAGFNHFVREQQKVAGECKLKLVQFDDVYEVVFDGAIRTAPELTQQTFVPRGSTALLDAQGRTIVELGFELDRMREEDKPSKVIIVTLTDGHENASTDYTTEEVARLVKEQRERYGWDFVYLGANQDAIRVAASMNIPRGSTMTYNATAAGTRNTMRAMSNYVGQARGMGQAVFSEEDRKSALDGDDTVQPI